MNGPIPRPLCDADWRLFSQRIAPRPKQRGKVLASFALGYLAALAVAVALRWAGWV